ncbi:unnamed protein product [Cylindrotheca closterium]|uniref:Uncharacterized protein n=1 Tax=Cylindrotheca closterium TaxID=2856 RepID=A0AAD2JLC4_9STRA|nr:unnamed protein product [Cylindrotheca closterium]
MTASYFRRNETNGDPSRLLVAATVNRNSDNNTVESVDHGHAIYSLLLSSFASELSKHQQRVFTALLFYTKVHGAANKANTTMLPLRVPEEPKVLRKLVTDGTKSIRDVLSRPTIEILGISGYVYVSIQEIVQYRYHLANRKRLEALVDLPYSAAVRTLHGSSPREKKLAAWCSEDSKDAIPVEVVLWSDDFDPNNTKKNKGSAHCTFASIGTPQDDYHSGCNTYLLSLGPSSGDERAVKSKIAEELIRLSHPTSFYWPVMARKVNTK